jgi:hypothetical protein
LLIPLSLVDYDIFRNEILERFRSLELCDLPEYLTTLIVAAIVGRPVAFRRVVVSIEKEGGASSGEAVISTFNMSYHRHYILGRYVDVLIDKPSNLAVNKSSSLAKEWCNCERGLRQPDFCREVQRIEQSTRMIYLYLDSNDPSYLYLAQSTLSRLAGNTLAQRIWELADELCC